MRWWDSFCRGQPTASMPLTNPNRANSARDGKASKSKAFLVPSNSRDYYYHEGKKLGHYPADAALGLEVCYTPALARLMCLEGADETSYQKAQRHLNDTGGIQ